MRLLLALADPAGAIRTALLRDGHAVQRHVPASRLMPWRATAAADFAPEAVLADGDAGEALARRLGVPALRADLAAEFLPEFLADPFPPLPFRPPRRDPPELGLTLPDPPAPAWLPDIVLLNGVTLPQAPYWMAAARAIVAPEGAPGYLAHEETALVHPPGDPAPALARLVRDAALSARLAEAARRAFERRRAAAWGALWALVRGGEGR